jgi:hypothetical protein
MHKEAFKMVFSHKKYLGLSTTVFAGLLIALCIVSQFIFLSPIFVFHVPINSILDFVLIVIIASLSGIVTSLSVYRIHIQGNKIRKSGTGFFGSIMGVGTGACASCGSFGFAAASIFGTIGGTATSFLTNYEMPLRVVSIAILFYAYYASVKSITSHCKIIK